MKRSLIILPGEDHFPCDRGHNHGTPKEAETCERRSTERNAGRASVAAFKLAREVDDAERDAERERR